MLTLAATERSALLAHGLREVELAERGGFEPPVLFRYSRFPGARLKPLSHLSTEVRHIKPKALARKQVFARGLLRRLLDFDDGDFDGPLRERQVEAKLLVQRLDQRVWSRLALLGGLFPFQVEVVAVGKSRLVEYRFAEQEIGRASCRERVWGRRVAA